MCSPFLLKLAWWLNLVFQVQLDLSEGEEGGGVDNRSGTFVMYNCARLATLLHSFQQQVEQGEGGLLFSESYDFENSFKTDKAKVCLCVCVCLYLFNKEHTHRHTPTRTPPRWPCG